MSDSKKKKILNRKKSSVYPEDSQRDKRPIHNIPPLTEEEYNDGEQE